MYAGNLYGYTPTLAGGIIFTILFLATTAYHTFQLSKARCWYFIPFVIGGICMSFLRHGLPISILLNDTKEKKDEAMLTLNQQSK